MNYGYQEHEFKDGELASVDGEAEDMEEEYSDDYSEEQDDYEDSIPEDDYSDGDME